MGKIQLVAVTPFLSPSPLPPFSPYFFHFQFRNLKETLCCFYCHPHSVCLPPLSPVVCIPQGKEKVKKIPLKECRVKYRDPKMSDKTFVLVDGLGNQSKYSAKTASLAQAWVDKIRVVISQEEVRLRQEVSC